MSWIMGRRAVTAGLVCLVWLLPIVVWAGPVLFAANPAAPGGGGGGGDIQDGLVAHWKFENALLDETANSHDGAAVGGPTFDTGQDGQALVLNGTTQHVHLPTLSTIGFPFTVGGWVKFSALPSSGRAVIFTHGNTTLSGGWQFAVNSLAKLEFNKPGVSFIGFGQMAVVTGRWYYLAVTAESDTGMKAWIYDTSTAALYSEIITPPPGLSQTPNGSRIGAAITSGSRLQGSLDEWRVYDRVLEDDELATLTGAVSDPATFLDAKNMEQAPLNHWMRVWFGPQWFGPNLPAMVRPRFGNNVTKSYCASNLHPNDNCVKWDISNITATPDTGGVIDIAIAANPPHYPAAETQIGVAGVTGMAGVNSSPNPPLDGQGVNKVASSPTPTPTAFRLGTSLGAAVSGSGTWTGGGTITSFEDSDWCTLNMQLAPWKGGIMWSPGFAPTPMANGEMVTYFGGHASPDATVVNIFTLSTGRWSQTSYTPDITCAVPSAVGFHIPTPPGDGTTYVEVSPGRFVRSTPNGSAGGRCWPEHYTQRIEWDEREEKWLMAGAGLHCFFSSASGGLWWPAVAGEGIDQRPITDAGGNFNYVTDHMNFSPPINAMLYLTGDNPITHTPEVFRLSYGTGAPNYTGAAWHKIHTLAGTSSAPNAKMQTVFDPSRDLHYVFASQGQEPTDGIVRPALWRFDPLGGANPCTNTKTITAVANNGAGLIRVTTATAHGYTTGDVVATADVQGVPAANKNRTVTVIDATTYDQQGSTFSGAYTSGGTALEVPCGSSVEETITNGPVGGITYNGGADCTKFQCPTLTSSIAWHPVQDEMFLVMSGGVITAHTTGTLTATSATITSIASTAGMAVGQKLTASHTTPQCAASNLHLVTACRYRFGGSVSVVTILSIDDETPGSGVITVDRTSDSSAAAIHLYSAVEDFSTAANAELWGWKPSTNVWRVVTGLTAYGDRLVMCQSGLYCDEPNPGRLQALTGNGFRMLNYVPEKDVLFLLLRTQVTGCKLPSKDGVLRFEGGADECVRGYVLRLPTP